MIFKGYKIRVRCVDWEQIDLLSRYWKLFTSHAGSEKLIGLSMNWTDDCLYFDYAIGVVDDEETLNKIRAIDLSETGFCASYVEIILPEAEEWKEYKGKEKDLKQIYEKEIDCHKKPYDYELEHIDGKGNLEIKIHYINA